MYRTLPLVVCMLISTPAMGSRIVFSAPERGVGEGTYDIDVDIGIATNWTPPPYWIPTVMGPSRYDYADLAQKVDELYDGTDGCFTYDFDLSTDPTMVDPAVLAAIRSDLRADDALGPEPATTVIDFVWPTDETWTDTRFHGASNASNPGPGYNFSEDYLNFVKLDSWSAGTPYTGHTTISAARMQDLRIESLTEGCAFNSPFDGELNETCMVVATELFDAAGQSHWGDWTRPGMPTDEWGDFAGATWLASSGSALVGAPGAGGYDNVGVQNTYIGATVTAPPPTGG